MPPITIETAIVAALIAFVGALAGQLLGAFLGARYAADVSRKTQLELADLAFQRQWRERLVRPFLELAVQRLGLLSEFTATMSTAKHDDAKAIVWNFQRTDSVIHAAALASLGDEALTAASNEWMEAELVTAKGLWKIVEGEIYEPSDAEAVLHLMINLVELTAKLQYEAARYVSGISTAQRPRSRWARITRRS